MGSWILSFIKYIKLLSFHSFAVHVTKFSSDLLIKCFVANLCALDHGFIAFIFVTYYFCSIVWNNNWPYLLLRLTLKDMLKNELLLLRAINFYRIHWNQIWIDKICNPNQIILLSYFLLFLLYILCTGEYSCILFVHNKIIMFYSWILYDYFFNNLFFES